MSKIRTQDLGERMAADDETEKIYKELVNMTSLGQDQKQQDGAANPAPSSRESQDTKKTGDVDGDKTSFHREPARTRSGRVSGPDWERHKQTIIDLYMHTSLEDAIHIMEEKHSFSAK